MAKTSANYELMYIIDVDIGDEQIAAMVEKQKSDRLKIAIHQVALSSLSYTVDAG
jgi:ribosomal protein S6